MFASVIPSHQSKRDMLKNLKFGMVLYVMSVNQRIGTFLPRLFFQKKCGRGRHMFFIKGEPLDKGGGRGRNI